MTGQHTRTTLAAGACLTLGVAMAVAVGAVPRMEAAHALSASNSVTVRTAAAQLPHHHRGALAVRANDPAAPTVSARHHSVGHQRAVSAAAGAAHVHRAAPAGTAHAHAVTAATAAATQSTDSATESRHHGHHHKAVHHHARHHRHHHAAAKPVTPTAPTKAARMHPSAAAVQNAINGLKQFVHSILTPTAAQVAQFGDMVCTAFDQGDSYSHIKSVILSKVSSLPLTTVLPGAADYVVKTAVSLYCPAYAPKLG